MNYVTLQNFSSVVVFLWICVTFWGYSKELSFELKRKMVVAYSVISMVILPFPVTFLIIQKDYWKRTGLSFNSESLLTYPVGTCLKSQFGFDEPSFFKVVSYEKGNWETNVAILSEGQREVQVETRKGENIFNNIQAQKVDCSLAVLSNRPKTTADTQF